MILYVSDYQDLTVWVQIEITIYCYQQSIESFVRELMRKITIEIRITSTFLYTYLNFE